MRALGVLAAGLTTGVDVVVVPGNGVGDAVVAVDADAAVLVLDPAAVFAVDKDSPGLQSSRTTCSSGVSGRSASAGSSA